MRLLRGEPGVRWSGGEVQAQIAISSSGSDNKGAPQSPHRTPGRLNTPQPASPYSSQEPYPGTHRDGGVRKRDAHRRDQADCRRGRILAGAPMGPELEAVRGGTSTPFPGGLTGAGSPRREPFPGPAAALSGSPAGAGAVSQGRRPLQAGRPLSLRPAKRARAVSQGTLAGRPSPALVRAPLKKVSRGRTPPIALNRAFLPPQAETLPAPAQQVTCFCCHLPPSMRLSSKCR